MTNYGEIIHMDSGSKAEDVDGCSSPVAGGGTGNVDKSVKAIGGDGAEDVDGCASPVAGGGVGNVDR